MNRSSPCLFYATAPDITTAERLATMLVQQQLAACVSVNPQVFSVYRWQNKLVKQNECQLFIKSQSHLLPAIQQLFDREHPYDVPCLIQWPITQGHPNYLAWLNDQVLKELP